MPYNNKRKEPTSEQKDAIEFDGQSLLITAGPGAGKTYVLIERIKHLLDVKHVDAESNL